MQDEKYRQDFYDKNEKKGIFFFSFKSLSPVSLLFLEKVWEKQLYKTAIVNVLTAIQLIFKLLF